MKHETVQAHKNEPSSRGELLNTMSCRRKAESFRSAFCDARKLDAYVPT